MRVVEQSEGVGGIGLKVVSRLSGVRISNFLRDSRFRWHLLSIAFIRFPPVLRDKRLSIRARVMKVRPSADGKKSQFLGSNAWRVMAGFKDGAFLHGLPSFFRLRCRRPSSAAVLAFEVMVQFQVTFFNLSFRVPTKVPKGCWAMSLFRGHTWAWWSFVHGNDVCATAMDCSFETPFDSFEGWALHEIDPVITRMWRVRFKGQEYPVTKTFRMNWEGDLESVLGWEISSRLFHYLGHCLPDQWVSIMNFRSRWTKARVQWRMALSFIPRWWYCMSSCAIRSPVQLTHPLSSECWKHSGHISLGNSKLVKGTLRSNVRSVVIARIDGNP